MAERKSGPVKPPVIDLTARPAEPEKSAAAAASIASSASPKAAEAKAAEAKAADAKAADARPAEASKPSESQKPAGETAVPPARPERRRGAGLALGISGAIGGAVIATAVCYGLATAGLWPVPASDVDARIAALQSGLADSQKSTAVNTSALAALNTRVGGLESDFAAKLAAASDALAKVQQALGQLQAAKPQPSDLAPVEAEVKALSSRLDAVAAGASSADAGAIAANLASLQQTVSGLAEKLATLDSRGTATDAALGSLKAELASAKAAIDQAASAPSPKAIASAMQLPLLISALEADFAAGRPYAGDLDALKSAVPEAHVPASVSDFAANGLPAPGELSRRFEAAMPDIFAARPPATDSSWQGQATDWLKGLLALRPQGESAGDAPDAVLSRLEAAVGRHDFADAAKLLGQLPPGMQQAAGDVAAQIRALADADSFIAALRSTALAPASGVSK